MGRRDVRCCRFRARAVGGVVVVDDAVKSVVPAGGEAVVVRCGWSKNMSTVIVAVKSAFSAVCMYAWPTMM